MVSKDVGEKEEHNEESVEKEPNEKGTI